MELRKENIFNKKNIVFIISAYCIYIVYAIFFNGFGTSAPAMMEFYGITPTRQGLIFTMQSIGTLFMAVHLALHGERYNKINAFAAGTLMLGAGSISIGFSPPYAALVLLVILCGIGGSAIDIMLNSMIPELYPRQKNTLLPIAHAFFGTGAILSPLLVTTLVNLEVPSSFVRSFALIGALGIGLFLVFFIVSRRVIPETMYADMAAVRKNVSGNPTEIFKTKIAWIFLLAAVLYFSFIVGIINWLPTYCLEIGIDFNMSGVIMTAFFVGSLIMRFCAPFILNKMPAQKAYVLFSPLSAVVVTAALFTQNSAVMLPLVAIGGFMQGACLAFLLLMSIEAFQHRVASASSIAFVGKGIASMTAPLWMGALAEFTGLRVPLLLICVLMIFSAILVSRAK